MKSYLYLISVILLLFLSQTLNAQIEPHWVRLYSSPTDEDDDGERITTDGSSNVIVGGVTRRSFSTKDTIVLLKYDPEGNLLFQKKNAPVSNLGASISALTCDEESHIFMLYNTSANNMNAGTAYLIKYDSNGTELWHAAITSAGLQAAKASFILRAASGNLYVTGTFWHHADSTYVFTQKFNENGILQWSFLLTANDWNSLFNLYDAKLDAKENIWLAANGLEGFMGDDTATGYVIKIDSSGNQSFLFKDSINETLILTNNNDDAFVAGYKPDTTNCNSCGDQWRVRQFDQQGTIVWSSKWVNVAEGDFERSILQDAPEKILLCGTRFDGLQCHRFLIGTDSVQSFLYDDSAQVADFNLNRTVKDDAGNLFAMGSSYSLQRPRVLRFNASDSLIATATFDTLDGSNTFDFILAPEQIVYATGVLYYPFFTHEDLFTLKFCFNPDCEGIATTADYPDISNLLLIVFPNPFSDFTFIQFSLSESTAAEISLYDLSGRKIKTIAEGNYLEGNHQINFDSHLLLPGVYILQLATNETMNIQKIVIQ